MKAEDRKTVQMKITLTPEEYEILKEFSVHQNKPVSGAFMAFVREANVFKVLQKTNKAFKVVSSAKSKFKSGVKGVFSEI